MLDIRFIRENADLVKKAVQDKGVDCDIDKLLEVVDEMNQAQSEWDNLRHEQHLIGKELEKVGYNSKEAVTLIKKASEVKKKHKVLFSSLQELKKQKDELMLSVPNIPWDDAPVGPDANANKEIKKVGKPPKPGFEIKDHIALGTSLNLLDLDAGVKTSGFRGYYLKNEAVLMQQAILWHGLNKIVEAGFEPMIPPTILRGFALTGSGHFPFGKEEVYRIANPGRLESGKERKESVFLAGTSEPSLLAYFADRTFSPDELPKTVCAITPCYRSEVGSYGKDLKGLYRIHEFWKVEQVVVCTNDQSESDKWFDAMLRVSEEMLDDLDLPYRLVETSTGDMGAGKRRMVDIETWMPGRNGYGETHSCSDLTDWQARRLNIRVKEGNSAAFAYTLNNTVIASPRILIAILENNQQKDGSVKVPKVLQKMAGKKVLRPEK